MLRWTLGILSLLSACLGTMGAIVILELRNEGPLSFRWWLADMGIFGVAVLLLRSAIKRPS